MPDLALAVVLALSSKRRPEAVTYRRVWPGPLPYDPAKQRKRYKFDRAEIMARKSQPVERLAQGLAASCLSQPRT